jgi:Lrp/AsnC family transcriptional regulator, regulator for asnA, asnC and gidA
VQATESFEDGEMGAVTSDRTPRRARRRAGATPPRPPERGRPSGDRAAAGEEGGGIQAARPRGREGRVRGSPLLDDANKRIIEQLQQDGRRSYAAIAKAVGLSEAAVRQRVQRLVDTGVVQIVGVTDALTVGFNRWAMVGVRIDGDVQPVAAKIAEMDEVDYVVITAGSLDLLVEVVCEDDDHLLEILSKRIRAIPNVRSTETFVYLKLVKQTYDWGAR